MKPNALLVAAATCLAAINVSWGAVRLAPHRAVYDISLESATDRSGITGAAGRMVYEFTGSPCDGYTVKFRFIVEYAADEKISFSDQQTTTFEDANGERLVFATRSYTDSRLDYETQGFATRSDSRIEVSTTKPRQDQFTLAPALFPTQHMIDLFERIGRGETFYETGLYDANGTADEVMSTSVVIGRKAEDSGSTEEIGKLSDRHYWPVSIAYFEQSSGEGDETPSYSMAFRLHGNGVSRSILMDYGDFALRGSLTDLELLGTDPDCAR